MLFSDLQVNPKGQPDWSAMSSGQISVFLLDRPFCLHLTSLLARTFHACVTSLRETKCVRTQGQKSCMAANTTNSFPVPNMYILIMKLQNLHDQKENSVVTLSDSLIWLLRVKTPREGSCPWGRTGRARCKLLGTSLQSQRERGSPEGGAGRQGRQLLRNAEDVGAAGTGGQSLNASAVTRE